MLSPGLTLESSVVFLREGFQQRFPIRRAPYDCKQ